MKKFLALALLSLAAPVASAQLPPEAPLQPLTGTSSEATAVALCQHPAAQSTQAGGNLFAYCGVLGTMQSPAARITFDPTRYEGTVNLVLQEGQRLGLLR